MNINATKIWITHWEGVRYVAYDDANGIPVTPTTVLKGRPHIGVGYNLVQPGAQKVIEGLGLNYENVKTGLVTITPTQVDALLTLCLNNSIASARSLVPIFDTLTDNEQMVLVDLCFNEGREGFSKFVNTLKDINNQDWKQAAIDLANSKWYNIVGHGLRQRGTADTEVLAGTQTPQYFVPAIGV